MSNEKLINYLKTLRRSWQCDLKEDTLKRLLKMSEADNFETDITCQCGKSKKVNYNWRFQGYENHTCEPPDIVKHTHRQELKRQREMRKKLGV